MDHIHLLPTQTSTFLPHHLHSSLLYRPYNLISSNIFLNHYQHIIIILIFIIKHQSTSFLILMTKISMFILNDSLYLKLIHNINHEGGSKFKKNDFELKKRYYDSDKENYEGRREK